jgi:hypothetical protein
MFRQIRFKRPDNPILKRIAQPDIGPTPPELLTVGIGVTLGMIGVLALLSLLRALNPTLTILQIAAFPSAVILMIVIIVTATILTIRQTEGEAYELLRMTDIRRARMVWGLVGGIFYRLRKYILSFMWAFGLAFLPIALQVREISADEIDYTSRFSDPLFPLLLLFLLMLFSAAIGITFLLVTSGVMAALRYRSVGLAASMTVFSAGLLLLGGILMWLIVVSVAGGLISMILALLAVPIPYAVGLIFARRWRTNKLRLVGVTAYAPAAVIIFLLFTAILGFGRGRADQSDTILFWALNAIFSFFLILSIESEWGQPSCPELIVLLAWQGLLVLILALGEGLDSEVGFETVVWLVSNTLLVTPYAVGIGNIDRAQEWVWTAAE